MKFPYQLLALAALSLIITGCAGTGGRGSMIDPFIGGTNGIVMSFQEGTPPREIYDNGDSEFAVVVRLENQGEADVGVDSIVPNDNKMAFIELTGINPLQFESPVMLKTFAEEGITLTRMRKAYDGTKITGAPDVMIFDGFRFTPDIVGNQEVRIRANICYDYTTFSNTQICLKATTMETLQDNAICTLSGPREAKNSGAPVHVTNVQQYPLGRDKVGIQFTVENVGNGLIFSPSEYITYNAYTFYGSNPCDPTIANNPNRNKVYVRVRLNDDTSNSLINCGRLSGSNEGMVTLFSGSPQIIQCTLVAPQGIGSQAYTDTLRIDLDYMYYQFVQTPVLIRDVTSGIQ